MESQSRHQFTFLRNGPAISMVIMLTLLLVAATLSHHSGRCAIVFPGGFILPSLVADVEHFPMLIVHLDSFCEVCTQVTY